jgi:farnesyl-diphosphate farnesyltransferase
MTPELHTLLRDTSRSFYLTLRVLPCSIRAQISLAYLLARATDTVADTEILPVTQRLTALKNLRERILDHHATPLNFGALAQSQGQPAEKLLLEKIEVALAALKELSVADQQLIHAVLTTITSGQELDLRRFDGASASKIIALQTAAELDDYTYRVAGCVGEFWTRMCHAHLFPQARLDEKQFIADGIRFGQGLQLVNILRDLPADLKNGRCYLPLEKLALARLLPETLLSPANEKYFLPLFRAHLDRAEAHLAAGWRYTNTLPFGQFRVRLACAWPILIGVRTIEKLRAADVGGLQARVKISRTEVRQVIFHSLVRSPFPSVWRRLWPAGDNCVDSRAELA